jgi:hypothetical protein
MGATTMVGATREARDERKGARRGDVDETNVLRDALRTEVAAVTNAGDMAAAEKRACERLERK